MGVVENTRDLFMTQIVLAAAVGSGVKKGRSTVKVTADGKKI